MPFQIQSRKTVREALKTLIDAAMVGPSKVLQVCYAYQVSGFDDKDVNGNELDIAIIVLASNGSDRFDEDTGELLPEHVVYVNAHAFVLYEKTSDAGVPEWTEQQSEDALDEIEVQFNQLVAINADKRKEASPAWQRMAMIGKSDIDSVFMEGTEYRHEMFSLVFVVNNQG